MLQLIAVSPTATANLSHHDIGEKTISAYAGYTPKLSVIRAIPSQNHERLGRRKPVPTRDAAARSLVLMVGR